MGCLATPGGPYAACAAGRRSRMKQRIAPGRAADPVQWLPWWQGRPEGSRYETTHRHLCRDAGADRRLPLVAGPPPTAPIPTATSTSRCEPGVQVGGRVSARCWSMGTFIEAGQLLARLDRAPRPRARQRLYNLAAIAAAKHLDPQRGIAAKSAAIGRRPRFCTAERRRSRQKAAQWRRHECAGDRCHLSRSAR